MPTQRLLLTKYFIHLNDLQCYYECMKKTQSACGNSMTYVFIFFWKMKEKKQSIMITTQFVKVLDNDFLQHSPYFYPNSFHIYKHRFQENVHRNIHLNIFSTGQAFKVNFRCVLPCVMIPFCLWVSFDYCRFIELDYTPMESGIMVSMRQSRGFVTPKSPERHCRSALHHPSFFHQFCHSLLIFFSSFLHFSLFFVMALCQHGFKLFNHSTMSL